MALDRSRRLFDPGRHTGQLGVGMQRAPSTGAFGSMRCAGLNRHRRLMDVIAAVVLSEPGAAGFLLEHRHRRRMGLAHSFVRHARMEGRMGGLERESDDCYAHNHDKAQERLPT